MVEQFNNIGMGNLAGAGSEVNKSKATPVAGDGEEFKSLLMKSINEVNRMQSEAEQATTDLVTGKTDNQAEVFNAIKKADIAFQALMQIRNKLTDAYDEIKQMRV